MLLREDIRRIHAQGRQDPVWFVEKVLGDDVIDYQKAILRAVANNRKVSVRSCHGIGKSKTAGGMVAPWFLCCHYQSEVITTAPSLRQVQGIVWKEINRAYNESEMPLGGRCMKTRWDMGPSWFATGFTTSSNAPDKFQGWHPASGHGIVIVDEAAGVDQRLYDEGISSIVSSGDSKILLIGNPTNPVGDFRDSHKKGSGYLRIKVDAFQTPNFTTFGITQRDIENGEWEGKIAGRSLPRPYLVTPDWVADRYKRWGKDSALYRARVLAEFPLEGADNLIPIYLLDRARDAHLPADDVPRWGFDVASEGDDFSVVGCKWPSGRYRKYATWHQMRTTDQAARVEKEVRSAGDASPYEISVDSVGVGKGVFDILCDARLWNPRVSINVKVGEFKGSHKAQEPEYFLNARAEGYWRLREAFEAGEVDIDPEDDELYYQLSELRFQRTAGDKIRIENKKEFKARTGKSPDDADAMMYSFAGFSKRRIVVR